MPPGILEKGGGQDGQGGQGGQGGIFSTLGGQGGIFSTLPLAHTTVAVLCLVIDLILISHQPLIPFIKLLVSCRLCKEERYTACLLDRKNPDTPNHHHLHHHDNVKGSF